MNPNAFAYQGHHATNKHEKKAHRRTGITTRPAEHRARQRKRTSASVYVLFLSLAAFVVLLFRVMQDDRPSLSFLLFHPSVSACVYKGDSSLFFLPLNYYSSASPSHVFRIPFIAVAVRLRRRSPDTHTRRQRTKRAHRKEKETRKGGGGGRARGGAWAPAQARAHRWSEKRHELTEERNKQKMGVMNPEDGKGGDEKEAMQNKIGNKKR